MLNPNNYLQQGQIKPHSIWLMFIGLSLVVIGLIGCRQQDTPSEEETPPDALAEFGISLSDGAAPGYVPDEACAQCHREIFDSFMQVGMGNAFMRPRAEVFIEDFQDNHYHHEPSQRHYEMMREGDRLFFRRYQLDDTGQEIHIFEEEVDWILGSGYTSRSYLFQTEVGELYQLPIAWYSQTNSWGISPGYDTPYHLGVTRPVRRECMFCHNSYPNVPTGNDTPLEPHLYPHDMAEGLGCQRCHGPGGEHTRISIAEPINYEAIRTSIVNTDGSDTEALNGVCYQCHMQPTVAIPGTRHLGRTDYSFEAGDPLADYIIYVDIEVEDEDRSERFEINHHPIA